MEKRNRISGEQPFEYDIKQIETATECGNETAKYLRALLASLPAEPIEDQPAEVRSEQ